MNWKRKEGRRQGGKEGRRERGKEGIRINRNRRKEEKCREMHPQTEEPQKSQQSASPRLSRLSPHLNNFGGRSQPRRLPALVRRSLSGSGRGRGGGGGKEEGGGGREEVLPDVVAGDDGVVEAVGGRRRDGRGRRG